MAIFDGGGLARPAQELDLHSGSATGHLGNHRHPSGRGSVETTGSVVARPASMLALDRSYDSTWLWCRCSTLDIGVLGRIKCNRCFYRTAPAPTGKKGAGRKDGQKLQPKDSQTHGEPDGTSQSKDARRSSGADFLVEAPACQ